MADDQKSEHLDPAKTVIERVGGPEVASTVTGKHISRVYRWMYPKDRGGTGGFIPHEDSLKILAHAQAHDLPLEPGDFLQAPSLQEAS